MPVHHRAKLVITVIDGDRWLRVPRAQVSLMGLTGVTNAHGIAEMVVPWRQPLHVRVDAKGYGTRTVYEDFVRYRRVTLRVYRDDLQWPVYGAVAARTGAQTHIRLRPPFKTVWAIPLGGLIEFPAVVDDGVAYVGNRSGTVRAISMLHGRIEWRRDMRHGLMASSPAIAGRVLVVHGMDGVVYGLDRATGHVRWRVRIGSPIESSPVVRDHVDYFGAWNGRLYALDIRTLRLRWVRTLGAKITSSAALAGGTLFIGDYAGRVWAVTARTGRIRWSRSVGGRVYGTPAVAHGRVFVPSSTGGSLTALSTSGRYLWRVGTGAYVYSSPATWAGRVFFGSYNGTFYAVSAASGRVLWRVGTGGPVSGAAAVVDGVAYAGSFAHRIVGVNARTGKVVLWFRHGQYVPVSGNGGQLLLHGYSTLYAVQPK